jgi:hypothetical protein
MNKERFWQVFLYVSLVAIGGVVGFAMSIYSTIPLAQEVNILDLATLVVTVFLAVYVPAVLDRRLQTQRDRKTLLIQRVDDYQSFLRRINILVQDGNGAPSDVLTTVANLSDVASHRLETLASLVRNSRFREVLGGDIEKIKKLNLRHSVLLRDGAHSETGPGYVSDIIATEQTLYNELDEKASLLIFKISDQR